MIIQLSNERGGARFHWDGRCLYGYGDRSFLLIVGSELDVKTGCAIRKEFPSFIRHHTYHSNDVRYHAFEFCCFNLIIS